MTESAANARLLAAFNNLLGQLESRCVRALVVLAGDEDWAATTAASLLAKRNGRIRWVGSRDHSCGTLIEPGQYRYHLGTECEYLVFNTFDGLNPNALGALAGTVVGGGVLLLLTPELTAWPQRADPDYQRLGPSRPGIKSPQRFIQRFASLLAASSCWLVQQQTALPALPIIEGDSVAARPFTLTDDQQLALAAIDRVARGHRRRPLVLTADRGRGKSTALGIAAARLLAEGLGEVVVTAPFLAAVEPVFEHCLREYPGGQRRANVIHWPVGRLRFLPPDELQRTLPVLDLLLVDEAAAIPVPLLTRLLTHYPRVVFASTVHGYEGNGRGFALQFRDELERQTPGYKTLALRQPVRWAASDPVEPWLFKSLLLNAELVELADRLAKNPVIDRLSQDQLLAEPALLEQVFGLLVQAHYRTTPDDLRVLLDAPNLLLFVARMEGQVCGAVLVVAEGDLAAEHWQAVSLGERRLSGQVLPQVLAAQAGLDGHLGWTCWRVMRIAVHPALRRRGLGREMLRQVEQAAVLAKLDYLGSSFAASVEVLAFWGSAGFKPLHLGWRRDSSTGSHALTVARGLSARADEWIAKARARHAAEFPALLADHLQLLSAPFVAALLSAGGVAGMPPIDTVQRRLLGEFVDAHRQYETCSLAVRALALQLLCKQLPVNATSRDVLVLRCLQLRPWVEVAQHCGLAGKPQVLDVLRQACRQWLAANT